MNKTALITGGAKRIGKSMALHLAKNNWNVAIQYNKSKKDVLKLKSEISDYNIKFSAYKFNFESNIKFKDFFKRLNKDFGQINLLINNASVFDFDTIEKSNLKTFDSHINVNLKAPFFLSKYFVKNLTDKGLIINILDQRVKNITPYFTSYTISKCALEALTKSLALYLAPKIRVNGISPGPTIKSKHQTINQFKNQVSKTPLLKKVQLNEINNAIDYIIKCESVTGQVLTIDSGQSLGWANSKSKIFSRD